MAYTAKEIKAAKKIENLDDLISEQFDTVTDIKAEILSDGSKVYSLWIGNVEIACTNQFQAECLWTGIRKAIMNHQVVDIQAR